MKIHVSEFFIHISVNRNTKEKKVHIQINYILSFQLLSTLKKGMKNNEG